MHQSISPYQCYDRSKDQERAKWNDACHLFGFPPDEEHSDDGSADACEKQRDQTTGESQDKSEREDEFHIPKSHSFAFGDEHQRKKEETTHDCCQKGNTQVSHLHDSSRRQIHTIGGGRDREQDDSAVWDDHVGNVSERDDYEQNTNTEPKERLDKAERLTTQLKKSETHQIPPNEQHTGDELYSRILPRDDCCTMAALSFEDQEREEGNVVVPGYWFLALITIRASTHRRITMDHPIDDHVEETSDRESQ
jgi:hypothetical protein